MLVFLGTYFLFGVLYGFVIHFNLKRKKKLHPERRVERGLIILPIVYLPIYRKWEDEQTKLRVESLTYYFFSSMAGYHLRFFVFTSIVLFVLYFSSGELSLFFILPLIWSCFLELILGMILCVIPYLIAVWLEK